VTKEGLKNRGAAGGIITRYLSADFGVKSNKGKQRGDSYGKAEEKLPASTYDIYIYCIRDIWLYSTISYSNDNSTNVDIINFFN
jgi:hypothetical protein